MADAARPGSSPPVRGQRGSGMRLSPAGATTIQGERGAPRHNGFLQPHPCHPSAPAVYTSYVDGLRQADGRRACSVDARSERCWHYRAIPAWRAVRARFARSMGTALRFRVRVSKDLSSADFIALVDAKLNEIGAPPLAEQGAAFGTTATERSVLKRAAREELMTVLRVDALPFDVDAMIARFDALWNKGSGYSRQK